MSQQPTTFAARWQWQDTDGSWKDYSQKISNEMNLCKFNKTVKFSTKVQSYTITRIDNIQGMQENDKTKVKRYARRIQLDDFVWQFEGDSGYQNLTDNLSQEIDLLKHNETHTYYHSKWTYAVTKLSPTTATQINTSTNKQRKLRRLEINATNVNAVSKNAKLDILWQFEENSGTFTDMSSSLSTKMENLAVGNQIKYSVGQHQYTTVKDDEDTCTQTNDSTLVQRILRRILFDKTNDNRIVWQFLENDNKWYNCDSTTFIHSLENTKVKNVLNHTRGQYTYTVTKTHDIKATQVNDQTSAKRELRRKVLDKTLADPINPNVVTTTTTTQPQPLNPNNPFQGLLGLSNNNLQNENESLLSKKARLDFTKTTFSGKDHEEFSSKAAVKLFNKKLKVRVDLVEVKAVHCGRVVYDAILNSSNGNLKEKYLFHGTHHTVIPKIIQNGFNRDFNANHAYGKGVYFAANSQYSHGYTNGDSNGIRGMFVCKVIVGDYTKGTANMTGPPTKSDGRTQYDSLVNDVNKPTIFVICKDYHAIPLYLILYKPKN